MPTPSKRKDEILLEISNSIKEKATEYEKEMREKKKVSLCQHFSVGLSSEKMPIFNYEVFFHENSNKVLKSSIRARK